MFISDEHKYVYIAVPHTKSWSTRNWLRLFYSGCAKGPVHGAAIPEGCGGYFIWTTVRNPLDRAAALWRKIHREVDGRTVRVWMQDRCFAFPDDFLSFVRILATGKMNDCPKAQFSPQKLMLGDVRLDRVFRFEDVPGRFSELPFFSGHLEEFPHANKTKVMTDCRVEDLYQKYPTASDFVNEWAPDDTRLWSEAAK